MNIDIKEFTRLYYTCFDENDSIKVCGRDNCKSLLFFLQAALHDPSYGDVETGRLNVDAVVSLKKKLLDGESE